MNYWLVLAHLNNSELPEAFGLFILHTNALNFANEISNDPRINGAEVVAVLHPDEWRTGAYQHNLDPTD